MVVSPADVGGTGLSEDRDVVVDVADVWGCCTFVGVAVPAGCRSKFKRRWCSSQIAEPVTSFPDLDPWHRTRAGIPVGMKGRETREGGG